MAELGHMLELAFCSKQKTLDVDTHYKISRVFLLQVFFSFFFLHAGALQTFVLIGQR